MYRAAGHMVSVTIGSPRPPILVDPPPVDAHVNLSARKQISIALKLDSNWCLQKIRIIKLFQHRISPLIYLSLIHI